MSVINQEGLTQSQACEKAIRECLDSGMTNKAEIFTKVTEDLGIPRPTVRRVARDLREKIRGALRILEGDN